MAKKADPNAPKKPRGRPFEVGNPGGPGRPPKTLAYADELFLDELFKDVDVKVAGKMQRETQYKVFLTKLIRAGIDGNTPAKKLVLEYFERIEQRRTQREQEDKAAVESGVQNFNWDAAKEGVLQNLQNVLKIARREQRG